MTHCWLFSVGLADGSIACLGGVQGDIRKDPCSIIHIKEKTIGIVHPLGVTLPVPTWACPNWEVNKAENSQRNFTHVNTISLSII